MAGIPDSSFDVVLSVFGAMFAPSPDAVAAQMVRVCKKGGTIVMGNWIPGDPTMVAQLLKLSSEYAAAPPPGFVSPMLWSIESNVLERFGKAGIPADRISFTRETFRFISSCTPSAFADVFILYYGPTMNAAENARANGKEEEFRAKMHALMASHNEAKDGGSTTTTTTTTDIPAVFLRVTVKI